MPIDKNFIYSRKANTDAAVVVKKFFKIFNHYSAI